jgi:hypothetical protein
MTPEFKKIYSISKNIADLLKSEKGDRFIGIRDIKNCMSTDHFAKLLLSKTSGNPEKIKVLIATFFILNRKSQLSTLEGVLMNLYASIIDLYEDTVPIEVECGNCDGAGYEECSSCEGSGRIDCTTCDGEGTLECDTCSGEGTDECRYCDGKGTETEEDDEGDDIEVECVHCDGDGTENCRDCSGKGNFECFNCDGDSNFTCEDCAGQGEYTCGHCDGNGTTESGDLKYNIRRSINVTLGDGFLKYEGEFISLEHYNSIEEDDELIPFNIEVYTHYFNDNDITVEERRESVDMEDDFVEVGECIKLENFKGRIDF